MRDNLLDELIASIWANYGDLGAAKDAIIAALPDMVKPLVWEVDRNRVRSGDYVIFEFVSGFYLEAADTGSGPFTSLEAAKAAAQAHHVAQVLSAFGITPTIGENDAGS